MSKNSDRKSTRDDKKVLLFWLLENVDEESGFERGNEKCKPTKRSNSNN